MEKASHHILQKQKYQKQHNYQVIVQVVIICNISVCQKENLFIF